MDEEITSILASLHRMKRRRVAAQPDETEALETKMKLQKHILELREATAKIEALGSLILPTSTVPTSKNVASYL